MAEQTEGSSWFTTSTTTETGAEPGPRELVTSGPLLLLLASPLSRDFVIRLQFRDITVAFTCGELHLIPV